MLRHLRRRFRGTRGEPLASFALRVTAVSPYPEEPEDEEHYKPSLIVAATPEPGDPALTPTQLAIGTLLFVEWANAQNADGGLPTRLRAILPYLRPAVKHGRLGPDRYAAHRAGQRANYFHHRDAASYDVALHRDDSGLYLAVERKIMKGRWSEETTLFEAATVAPYEALLRLDPPEGLALLTWLTLAIDHWLAGEEAPFPVQSWPLDQPLAAP
ncbi:MAG: hypothetical protein U0841_05220 [Chloroflexia bacterium]